MSNSKASLIQSVLSLAFICSSLSYAQYMEAYSWSFQGGNLISNWSFENLTTEICGGDNPGTGATQTDCHFRMGTGARSGNYAMKVVAKNEGNSTAQPFAISQISSLLPIEPSTPYTFSFYMQVNWSEQIPSSAPVACWLRADKSFIGCSPGQPYLSVFPNSITSWTPYSFSFQTASDAQYLYFHLIQSSNDGVTGQSGDTYLFDDLQIRKNSESPGVVGVRSYANAAGRVDHTIVSDGIKDVITKREFDAIGRMSKEYLPITQTLGLSTGIIVVSALDLTGQLVVDYRDLKSAYDALSARVLATSASLLPPSLTFDVIVGSNGDEAPLSGVPYDIDVLKSADGVYVPLDVVGIIRGSAEYNVLVQTHMGQSASLHSQGPFTGDYQYLLSLQYPGESNLFNQITYPSAGVNTLSESSLPGSLYGPGNHTRRSGTALLSTPNTPPSVEDNTDEGNVEAPYLYSWTRDPQGKYTMQIQDERGLVLKSGTADATTPTNDLDWLLSRTIYDDLGRQTSLESPAAITTHTVYNGQGQVIQTTDPDRGMNEVLYDSLGRARFTRSPDGRQNDYMVVIQYDGAGRKLGSGRVNTASTYFTQANADNPTFPGVSALNQGSLFDALEPSAFEEATGIPLSSLGFTPQLQNGQGKEVMAFNRNLYAVPPGNWTQAQFLVSTFNSYDSLGRLQERWKYIGAAPSGQRWHKFKYSYDVQGRLASTTVFNDQTESQVVTQCNYVYDTNTGKVTEVVDKDGNVLTSYTYDFLNRTTKVDLLGNAEIEYAFDVQNKPLSTTGTVQGKNVFQELMSYESKPNVNIANTDLGVYPRFDGFISSLLRKFSGASPNPVEWWRYAYDVPGRMVASFKHLPSSGGNLTPAGNISYPVTFNTAPAVERDYEYSDDGAIQSQSNGIGTYLYGYANGTHQISSITPNWPGRTTSAGSFVFDLNGRLWKDNGTGKTFLYNFADRPVRVQIPRGADHFLYDENDARVATLEDIGGVVLGRQIVVYESGLKVTKEIMQRETGHPDGAINVTKYHEYGKSGLVSIMYSGSTDRQVLLKDHLGSVMAAVTVGTGRVEKEQGYQPYGVIEQRVVPGSDLAPSEAFTGKEYVEAIRLYDFGARWYDPELGFWISPDAGGQYLNPYAYGGGNPVIGFDQDGNWFIVDDIIGGVVGAAVGAYTAYQHGYDLTDWQTYAYIGGGAAIGVATVETGGAAAGAFSSLGAIGSGAVAGAAGGAVGGLANYSLSSGVESGFRNFNAGDAWHSTWTGAASGAIGGAAGGYLGTARWNLLGRGGAAFGGGFAAGFSGGLLNGQSLGSASVSGLEGGAISYGADLGDFAVHRLGPTRNSAYDHTSGLGSNGDVESGDVIAFGGHGGGTDLQQWITHEDFSHVGQVIDEGGKLRLREANITGHGTGPAERLTDLPENRPYVNLHHTNNVDLNYIPRPTGYILPTCNCATNGSVWGGYQWTNNPGVLVRNVKSGY